MSGLPGGLPLNITSLSLSLPTTSPGGSNSLTIYDSQNVSSYLGDIPSYNQQISTQEDLSSQKHTSIYTDPGCSFQMIIADSKAIRQLIDYCKQKNSEGFFYVSAEGFGYSRHDNDSTVVNLAFLYRDSMLDFNFNSNYPSIGFHLDMAAFSAIIKTVKKEQISIEKTPNTPEIGIRPVSHSDAGDNSGGNPSITFLRPLEKPMLNYRFPNIDPNAKPVCVVSTVDFCNKCSRVCSSNAPNIRMYSFQRGIFFQATDPVTQTVAFQVLGQITQDELKTCQVPPNQAGSPNKQLVSFNLSGSNTGSHNAGNANMIWYKGALSTMLIGKEILASFLKLNTITRDSIVRIYMGPKIPTRIVLPISYIGELIIVIRNN